MNIHATDGEEHLKKVFPWTHYYIAPSDHIQVTPQTGTFRAQSQETQVSNPHQESALQRKVNGKINGCPQGTRATLRIPQCACGLQGCLPQLPIWTHTVAIGMPSPGLPQSMDPQDFILDRFSCLPIQIICLSFDVISISDTSNFHFPVAPSSFPCFSHFGLHYVPPFHYHVLYLPLHQLLAIPYTTFSSRLHLPT